MSVLDRHEDKWTPEPNSGCYLWHGAVSRGGYGNVRLPGRRTGAVHRLVCEEIHGPAPDGAQGSHLCHTPACVNPAHLIWESPKENMARLTPEKRNAGGPVGGPLGGRARALNAGQTLRNGVHPKGNRWRAMAGSKYLGNFATEAEARAARDEELRRKGGTS
jgi:hypothetical protein